MPTRVGKTCSKLLKTSKVECYHDKPNKQLIKYADRLAAFMTSVVLMLGSFWA